MNPDNIAWYSNIELRAWFKLFDSEPEDVLRLPGVPFSYSELRRELHNRQLSRELALIRFESEEE